MCDFVNVNPPSTANPNSLPSELSGIAEPDETALLGALRGGINRAMLEEIAFNDYGEEVLDHMSGIEKQISLTPTLGRLAWCPREVLERERWAPEKYMTEQGHIKRLLSCTILLRNAGHIMSNPADRLSDDGFFLETSAASAIRLLRSALALGSSWHRPALAFKLWLYHVQPYPPLRPLVALTSALLGIAIYGSNATPEMQTRIMAWVDAVEGSCRTALGSDVESERWLLGLNTYERSPDIWLGTICAISSKLKRESGGPLLSRANAHLVPWIHPRRNFENRAFRPVVVNRARWSRQPLSTCPTWPGSIPAWPTG